MKKLLLILMFLSISISYAQKTNYNPEISQDDIKKDIYYLASDAMKGRFTGSPEARKAGEYIKEQFVQSGLKPLFNGSYFQEFPFIEDVELTDNNSLSVITNGKGKDVKLRDEFITEPFSGNVKIKAGLVFVGYGISAPKLNYDDYDGIDVNGKIVIAMRYSPEYNNPHSDFDDFASLRKKAFTAREKGAIGIIFVNGFMPEDPEDKLTDFRYDRAPGMPDFAAVHIKRNIIDALLKNDGKDLLSVQTEIDSTRKPVSFSLTSSADLTTEVKEIHSTGRNVGGILEGSDPVLKNQYIVIGGHYDHLGMGKVGSLYRGPVPQIHNGADDNASGTTGVLELAEKFGSIKDQLKRSIIFVTFSGEELGLLGSAYLTEHFPVNIDSVAAMLNMDMIGRLNDKNELIVIGAGTSSQWKDILAKDNTFGFTLSFNEDGLGGSDHQSFTLKNIPVLFFFTGTHEDYHRPTDDADKINYPGEEKVVKYVYAVASSIDDETARPDFIKVETKASEKMRFKVSIGTVPDYAYQGEGYKLSGVSEGGPAQEAGLKGGDIMTKFGDRKITNIYDFMYAMGEHAPGDKVPVIVLRDGKEMTFEIVLRGK